MTEGTFADHDAERVAGAIADAFEGVLGARLQALVVHGSAITGYIRDFSDFDFVLFAHGKLTLDDDFALGERLHDIDHSPFAYLQLSRLVDVDDPTERMSGLIEGAYAIVRGALPPGWSLLTEEVLRERGRESIERVPGVIARLSADWAVAGQPERSRIIRYLATVLKPALRATLAELGEPVTEVWRSPYPELARRLVAHDAALGERMAVLVGELPPAEGRRPAVARELFALLATLSTTYHTAQAAGEAAPTSNI